MNSWRDDDRKANAACKFDRFGGARRQALGRLCLPSAARAPFLRLGIDLLFMKIVERDLLSNDVMSNCILALIS